jgi:hypothetical protein
MAVLVLLFLYSLLWDPFNIGVYLNIDCALFFLLVDLRCRHSLPSTLNLILHWSFMKTLVAFWSSCWLIYAIGTRFPQGGPGASSSLRSCGVSANTLIPQESRAFRFNQL